MSRSKIAATLVLISAALSSSGGAASSGPGAATEPQQQQQGRPDLRAEGTPRATGEARGVAKIAREVRNELITLPFYNVFDWIEGEVKPDGTVALRGQVTRPTLKSDAEGRVKDVEGVSQVANDIEVLPLSPNNDRIRRALYARIFRGNGPLFQYAYRAVPPIHLIVNRGNVTLKGVVATQLESTYAYTQANSTPGVFGVTNELVVESARPR